MVDGERLLAECRPCMERSELPGGHFAERVSAVRETLPKLLVKNAKEAPSALSMRKKDFGIWNACTWAEVYEKVKGIAQGLRTLGIGKDSKVCIIGDNDPEWYWSELAVQSIGGVVVGFYVDAMPADIEYVVNHSDSVLAFAKDQEQVDKFLAAREKLPRLGRVIYWDSKGMAGYRSNPWLMEISELMEAGKAWDAQQPGSFELAVEQGRAKDLAALCYTSGTTGLPKGAMISHEYLIKASVRLSAMNLPQADDEFLSFVPPAWIAEQMTIAGWLIFRTKANFPEEPETVMENVREIGPSSLLLGPTQWLGLVSAVQMKIFETGALRRLLYRVSLAIGYRTADFRLNRKPVPLYWRALHALGNWICLYHIRDALGLSKTRAGITGGSALGPDVFRWFLAIGVRIRDAYGLTELTPVTSHGELVKPGTSGEAVPGVEVKIDERGEILARSDALFSGYYKNPAATDEMLEDGWIRTGDCGTIDPDDHLIVYDRMKDMLSLRSGAKYSPTYVQNRLRFSPYIKDALILGKPDVDFLFAIVTIDFDNVGKWAEKRRIAYTTFVDLSQKDEVYALVEKDVRQVNSTLPEQARLGRFTLLHKEFDADEGELTKTRKLRRAFLEERYAELIGAAFEGKEKVMTEALVRYRDGRESTVKTELKIRTVRKETT